MREIKSRGLKYKSTSQKTVYDLKQVNKSASRSTTCLVKSSQQGTPAYRVLGGYGGGENKGNIWQGVVYIVCIDYKDNKGCKG